MPEEPAELLHEFQRGDLDAFEALFRKHQGEVYRWIVRIVRDPAAAEDLAIETFWRVYRSRERFDLSKSFGAWVRRIATNAALDHLRAARIELELPGDLASPPAPIPGTSAELRRAMARAFARLPPKLRVAATLTLIEEQPYAEIAEALGISEGAVRLRVHRSVRILRKELKRQGFQP